MRVFRVRCGRCGLEATRYGEGARSVVSVNTDEQSQLCQMVADARARGEPSDALSVDCRLLNAAEVVDERGASPARPGFAG
jgi:hypothetical protein